MKKSLFEKLCCPECRGELELKIVEGDLETEVVKGSLTCKACGVVYPILEKIPRLLPSKFTKESLNTGGNVNVGGENV